MNEIITFNKSLQQRLQEYYSVFDSAEMMNYSQIPLEWFTYLELNIDPCGWQAIWKIPRLKCEHLKIPFPSVVLVYVLDVVYKDLTALVRVLSTQDDICIPEKHFVELSQLWVTKEQDKSIGLNLQNTADVLDQFRFFYVNLLMPWDRDLDDNIDWRDKYLESRLRLHYDLKNGLIPKVTAARIYTLINEAKKLDAKRLSLEEIMDNEDTHVEVFNSTKIVTNNKNAEVLLEMYVRMTEIKNEMELLEDPVSRSIIIKKHESYIPTKDCNSDVSIWLICNTGTADEYINFLEKVKKLYSGWSLTFARDLLPTMEAANSGDIFVLKNTDHVVEGAGAIIENWTIQGTDIRDKTRLVSKVSDVLLDFVGNNAKLENLTVDSKSTHCAILVRSGIVTLRNCKIIGDGNSSTMQGVIVLAGAELHVVDSEITGFAVSIVGNSNSNIKLHNCSIHDGIVGLKIYDNCIVNAENTTFHNCKEYGVVIETERDTFDEEKKVINFETLNIIPDLKTQSVTGQNNVKGDVIIKKPTLKAKADLFSNPNMDPTVIEIDDSLIELSDGDEEMETAVNGVKSEPDASEPEAALTAENL